MTTHADLIAAIHKIGGGEGRGMIKAAAAAADLGRRSIERALAGDASPAVTAAILAAAERIDETEATRVRASTWMITHPTDRQPGRDVVDEAGVYRTITPRIFFHAEMLRGKADDGGSVWRETIDWIDQPSSDERRSEIVDEARRRARDVIYDRSQATATSRMREHYEGIVRRAGVLTDGEIAALSYRQLVTEAQGVDLHDRAREIDDLIAEKSAEWLALPQTARDAVRADDDAGSISIAEQIGALKMMRKFAYIAETEAPGSIEAAYILARAYDLMPLTPKGTARRPPAPAPVALSADEPVFDLEAALSAFDDLPDEPEDPEIASRKRVAGAVRALIRRDDDHADQYAALTDDEKVSYEERLARELTA